MKTTNEIRKVCLGIGVVVGGYLLHRVYQHSKQKEAMTSRAAVERMEALEAQEQQLRAALVESILGGHPSWKHW